MNYFIVVVILGSLILIHELGHFLAAKIAGIPVALFSVGFGPALVKKRIGNTEYRLSLVPLGGYILPAVRDEHDYFLIPVNKRVIFALGGPAANLLVVPVLYAVLNVMQGGFSVAGIIVEPFAQTALLTQKIIAALLDLFTQHSGVMGIIGILHQGGSFISEGVSNTVKLALALSANLAVFNMLPLPTLDGGKIIFSLLEKISTRLRKIYVPIMVVGWLLITGLMIYATILDAGRLLVSFS
jgi:regulator of sigma E protease